jgi:thiol-disulfide isomerase/thioredoxin
MGRLPPLACAPLALGLALAGCDQHSAPAQAARSEQVMAGDAAPSTPPASSLEPGHAATRPARTEKLCAGDGHAKGRTVPKTRASHAEAAGAPALDGALQSTGQWTWINFWAAWCAPCKEEIPRLVDWRERLARAGTPVDLVFVSLDDDERQLRSFLDSQPPAGVRSTLWLPDGAARAAWLSSLHMASAPELPQQALVDARGRVRCFIEGAVEDGDYEEIASLVR